jgi:outer membrane protein assembly factor BamB
LRRLGALLLFSTLACGQDWTRFRGPNGSGVLEAANLPEEFGPDKNLLWKTPLPPGHSSPVYWGTRLYLTAVDEYGSLYTYCLDRETGEVRWRREIERRRREKLHKLNNPAAPTPVTDGAMVYSFFPDFGLVAYTLDGLAWWKAPLGPFHNVYGIGVSPILAGDSILLVIDQGPNSWIGAFSKETGKLLWHVPREHALSGHSTPILWEPRGGPLQALAPGSFRLDAYEVATGKTRWFYDGLPGEMKSVPVMSADTIYIHGFNTPENDPGRLIRVEPFEGVVAANDKDKDGVLSREEAPTPHSRGNFPYLDLNGDGKLDASEWTTYTRVMRSENALLAIRLGGQGDVSATALRWKHQRSIPQLPSPLLYRGVLYTVNEGGILTTLDPESGMVHKTARLRGTADQYYASPVAGDGKVYIASNSGVVSVLAAGANQTLLAANDLGEPIFATPALAPGRLYLRTQSALYCFGTR